MREMSMDEIRLMLVQQLPCLVGLTSKTSDALASLDDAGWDDVTFRRNLGKIIKKMMDVYSDIESL